VRWEEKCEETLPAGTRVRVYGGNEDQAPSGEAGMEQRFCAAADQAGTLRLPPEGAELRLLSPKDAVLHRRRFLPPTAYSAINNARVLRRRDGTAFFLFVPAGNAAGTLLDAGEYRLNLTYKRDNTSADPDSRKLSQAGSTATETATLDVPWEARGSGGGGS